LALLTLLMPLSGWALSCAGLRDEFYIRCESNTCVGEFSAIQVAGARTCGRRVVVEAIATNSLNALAAQVKRRYPDEAINGLYQLSFTRRFHSDAFVSTDHWQHMLQNNTLNGFTLWVEKLPANTDVQKLREQWQAQASDDARAAWFYWLLQICSVLFALGVIYKTTMRFIQSVKAFFDKKSKKLNIIKPLAWQVLLFFVVAPMTLVLIVEVWFVIFTIPLLLLVWVYEAYLYLALSRTKGERKILNT
jgi:hypothetical protein